MPIRAGADPKYIIHDGMALDATVWRVTGDALSVDEFLSYVALEREIMAYQFFRATSVSMYLTRQGAVNANQKFNLGSHLAELELRDNRIMLARSGGADHISVWAPPGVLYNSVVNFDPIDDDQDE